MAPKEVAEYLNTRNIIYDSTALHVVNEGEPRYTVMINKDTIMEIKEGFKLDISPDKMQATARFYAPSLKGGRYQLREFLDELAIANIHYGVAGAEIEAFMKNIRYCEDIVVARGKEPRHGVDARIEYYFNMDLHARPTLKEDGSVDFFNLNTINHCQKGEVIAKLFPEDLGEPGINITGEKVKGRDVKRKYLKYGRNITISDDKLTMISEVNGHVTLVDDKVFVSDVFEVENVDNSTGNIEYEGSVQIHGNVCTNFRVEARGNIEVKGIVEGAYLKAGGDIILARGINGMGRGELRAEGNIVAKFMENTTAIAGGYISTGSILHSTIQAGDEITVDGKRGFITGGRVCATHKVTAKTLGTAMGADTIVEVGADPNTKMKIAELQKKIAEAARVVRSVQPVLTATQQKLAKGIKLTPEQVQYMKSLIALTQAKNKEIEDSTVEIERLQISMGESVNAQVVVTDVVYPGTKICIGDLSMIVHSQSHYCKFLRAGGDVKMTGL